MAVMGLVLYSTMALASPFLQNVIGYPIISAGLLLATRGFGTFVAMMMVGRLMRHFEARTLIISGLSLTAFTLYSMSGWTDQTGTNEIVALSIMQGFGFGLVFVPLSTVAFLSIAASSAHRRHLDADLDAQRRKLDRHFHRDLAAHRGLALAPMRSSTSTSIHSTTRSRCPMCAGCSICRPTPDAAWPT